MSAYELYQRLVDTIQKDLKEELVETKKELEEYKLSGSVEGVKQLRECKTNLDICLTDRSSMKGQLDVLNANLTEVSKQLSRSTTSKEDVERMKIINRDLEDKIDVLNTSMKNGFLPNHKISDEIEILKNDIIELRDFMIPREKRKNFSRKSIDEYMADNMIDKDFSIKDVPETTKERVMSAISELFSEFSGSEDDAELIDKIKIIMLNTIKKSDIPMEMGSWDTHDALYKLIYRDYDDITDLEEFNSKSLSLSVKEFIFGSSDRDPLRYHIMQEVKEVIGTKRSIIKM